jgi:hypothetical protein
MNNILDLDKSHNILTNDLQANLKQIENTYGNKFFIKYNLAKKNIMIKVDLLQKKLPNDTSYYQLVYDIPNRTYTLQPLIIDFIDIVTYKLNNNSHIFAIHKTDDITGTEMVHLALQINKVFGVEKTDLIDIAKINHNDIDIDLSFMKLIEYNNTFYMRCGFDFHISSHQYPSWHYESKDKLKDKINNLISSIHSIKTSNLINEYYNTLDLLNNYIKNINKFTPKKPLIIMLENESIPLENKEKFQKKPEDEISNIFQESYEVLKILHKYTDIVYLYEILIKLLKENLDEFVILYKHIIMNKRTKIIYDNSAVNRDYIFDINVLFSLRNVYVYSYLFS